MHWLVCDQDSLNIPPSSYKNACFCL
jgi:hypothetical protein